MEHMDTPAPDINLCAMRTVDIIENAVFSRTDVSSTLTIDFQTGVGAHSTVVLCDFPRHRYGKSV
jgi:hypothetical protein